MRDGHVVARINGNQEHNAVFIRAASQVVGIPVRFRVLAHSVGANIIHDGQIHIALVRIGKASRLGFHGLQRAVGKKLVVVAHVRGGNIVVALCQGGGDRCASNQQCREKAAEYFFHGAPSYSIKNDTAPATATNGMKIRKNQLATFPLSIGKSPMSFPVCPFMAKRKSWSFHLVCSIHTGSNA